TLRRNGNRRRAGKCPGARLTWNGQALARHTGEATLSWYAGETGLSWHSRHARLTGLAGDTLSLNHAGRTHGGAHSCLILGQIVEELPLVILLFFVVDLDSGALGGAGHAGDPAPDLQSPHGLSPRGAALPAWRRKNLVDHV